MNLLIRLKITLKKAKYKISCKKNFLKIEEL